MNVASAFGCSLRVAAVLLLIAAGPLAAQAGVPPAGPASTQAMLLHVAPDSGYVYLSWNQVPGATHYQVQSRRLSTQPWQIVNVPGPAYHYSVTKLQNDVTYEFRVSALNAEGGALAVGPVLTAAPSMRMECLSQNNFGCSIRDFRNFMNASPAGPPFQCHGVDVVEPSPDLPNCTFQSADRLFGLDRFFSRTFKTVPVPSKALVRTAARRAIWGDANPFDFPERFALTVLPSGVADKGLVQGYQSAESRVIRQTPEISSRVTIFKPLNPIPGQYLVYVEGHGAAANTFGADFLSWFLVRGWTVASLDMPLEGANAPDVRFPVSSHDDFRYYAPAKAHPFDLFLLPVKLVIDQLLEESPSSSNNVVLAGRSGGGWTTCLYGALDERVTVAINISGCWPRSVAMDPEVLRVPNVLHFETLQPEILDEVSMLEFIVSAGTRGNFHFYSTQDPSMRFSESSPFVRYLRGISALENRSAATRNRTRVFIGTEPVHGLLAPGYAALAGFLKDLGLPVAARPIDAETP